MTLVQVGDIASLGEPLSTLSRVEPGRYKTGWVADWGQLERHFWLDSPADYPAADGPDVTLYLSPL